MINKILLCCRGEIALRFIRSCRMMGIRVAIIHSSIDKEALFTLSADETICIPSWDMNTAITDVIDAAKVVGADAIAPGYGPLAENSEFSSACIKAGFKFVGPNKEAIFLTGDKLLARSAAQRAGVPVIPGQALKSDLSDASSAATKIGYPIIIKAALGGGGRGIRIVHHPKNLVQNLQEVQQEALSAFGSDNIYIEKYLGESVRHVEIQVLGDTHGNSIHLGSRGCSVQRRQQKIVEEAPAPEIDPNVLENMHESALALAREISYDSAGTVEFLLDSNNKYYFMEMNARIQVEHPVTEFITGVDLVTEMIRIADGEKLQFRQSDIQLSGHAIEFRICAEDPYNKFLPTGGTVNYYRVPEGAGIRVESGISSGSLLPISYDSLCLKIIVWNRNRGGTLARARQALSELQITGFPTNLPFHNWLLSNKEFEQGSYNLSLFSKFNESSILPDGLLPDSVIGAILFHYLNSHASKPVLEHDKRHAPSPWRLRNDEFSRNSHGR